MCPCLFLLIIRLVHACFLSFLKFSNTGMRTRTVEKRVAPFVFYMKHMTYGIGTVFQILQVCT